MLSPQGTKVLTRFAPKDAFRDIHSSKVDLIEHAPGKNKSLRSLEERAKENPNLVKMMIRKVILDG
jgi:hypothetical protein